MLAVIVSATQAHGQILLGGTLFLALQLCQFLAQEFMQLIIAFFTQPVTCYMRMRICSM